jgi:ParB family transcriptional regulator, chromosome partitioning protein
MHKATETAKKRTALGQGLNALLPLDEPIGPSRTDGEIKYLPIETLVPNPYQPRRKFGEESLAELSNSIKEMGVIQPLIVRSLPSGACEIVAGERRWRAAAMAGSSTVPVIVRELSDVESLEIALIENLQREDLNPMDTAEAYDLLIRKYSYTHEALAQRIGKDRTNITNHVRLLKLPEPVKQYVREDLLSMGHARTLLGVEHVPLQLNLSQKVLKRKLSVRELERIVQNYKAKQEARAQRQPGKDPDVARLEASLTRHLSTKVVITKKADQAGKLEIHFHSVEELDRILDVLGYRGE